MWMMLRCTIFYPFFFSFDSLPSGSPPSLLSEACVRLGAFELLSLLLSVDPHASTQDRGRLLPLPANWNQRSGGKRVRNASERGARDFFFRFPFRLGGGASQSKRKEQCRFPSLPESPASLASPLPRPQRSRHGNLLQKGTEETQKQLTNKTKTTPPNSLTLLGRRRRAERAAAAAAAALPPRP